MIKISISRSSRLKRSSFHNQKTLLKTLLEERQKKRLQRDSNIKFVGTWKTEKEIRKKL
jgi:hypothetical protein